MGTAYQIRDQGGSYFLTFQVVGWVDVFSRQLYRDIILESFRFCRASKGMILYSYVIMTNHVHVMMRSESGDLSGLVRDFKKYTSKKILDKIKMHHGESRLEWMEMVFKYHAKYNKRVSKLQLWTHENHAVELNTNELFDTRINYIHENPVRSGWVEKAEDYLYSSARNYAQLDALIDVDLI
ncbi:transposase [Fulvivirgaceae bacterium BMA12]|uniref:Transposase n=1 Tax=Agaribacillus aureus TaxID=3051825 RepID=A0ABT8LI78_9BACT|nr:transposase [Fulvivirgaceae bacterium BMA12]